MSADAPVGPAFLVNPVGQGTVLTFAGSPDYATASEHHIVEARDLLRRAVRLLHPNPRVLITAPVNVEAVVTDEPSARTLRVHLLGYNAPPQATPPGNRPYALPRPIEDAPLYRATILLDAVPRSARALLPTTVIARKKNRLDLTVAGIHETVVVRY
jgi:hypothetical protein